jgi:1-acyl-sn-glycerol-3-phosphate acyltransferase
VPLARARAPTHVLQSRKNRPRPPDAKHGKAIMTHDSQFRLLFERRFGPFFLTQLAGAFNDNLLKQVLVLLVTYHAGEYTTLAPGIVTSLAGGLFILPFVLFSSLAGQLADRFDKARLLQIVKAAELLIMAVAAAGFYRHSLAVLLTALFLMGMHSTFFGPAKYSLLPRVLSEAELVGGNGLLEMGTFVAILAGTLCAGLLVATTADPLLLTLALTLVAGFGFACSLGIPPTGSAAPDLVIDGNLARQTIDIVRRAARTRAVWMSLLGISWFWFFGAAFLSQLPVLVRNELQADESVVTLLLAVFAVGVGVGSASCEKLSGGRVELGLVPFGSIGMTLFAADMYLATRGFSATPVLRDIHALLGTPGSARVVADIGLLGLFGGLFSVPLYALVQSRSERAERSRIIAANNVLNALFMVAAAGLGALLAGLGASPAQIVGACALLNALVACYIYAQLPEFLWRFVAWLLVHTVYRVRIRGAQNIPEAGAAVLAPNHVSYADALVISAASPRPIRFVMDHAIFRAPLLGWLFRAARAIPIAPARDAPQVLERAYDEIARALRDGELVCLFPEGRLTPGGEPGELRRGILEVIARTPVPVIPIGIDGMQGSVFSRCRHLREGRRSLLLRRVEIAVGAPLAPGECDLAGLRTAIDRLRGQTGLGIAARKAA